jgi:hypothetical protein
LPMQQGSSQDPQTSSVRRIIRQTKSITKIM